MAVRLADQPCPDKIERILYVVREDDIMHYPTKDLGLYRGYRVDYLTRNLTELERSLMTCPNCLGLVRDATSYHDEIRCLLCNWTRGNPITKVRVSVCNLRIKCPLMRDCNWKGKIIDCEKHLKKCGSFLIKCTLGCGTVIKRCQNENHIKINCPLRKVNCKYCNKIIHFKDSTDHLKYCPVHPIRCKCGSGMCRGELSNHIETECPLADIECPYAKYSCKIGKILRKDLLAHKKEFYIEHQDMLELDNCRLKESHKMLEEECSQLRKALNEKKGFE